MMFIGILLVAGAFMLGFGIGNTPISGFGGWLWAIAGGLLLLLAGWIVDKDPKRSQSAPKRRATEADDVEYVIRPRKKVHKVKVS